MTAYFCPDLGTWSTEECDPDKCVHHASDHKLRHVGPDKIVQMMNAIMIARFSLHPNPLVSKRALDRCLEWLNAPNLHQSR